MTANNMKPQGRRRRTGTPSLRGLQGRSATGQNGQAAKEELSAIWGAGCRKNNSGVPAGRSVFHLTSPFIGLSHSHDYYEIHSVWDTDSRGKSNVLTRNRTTGFLLASGTGDGDHTGDRRSCASMFGRLPKGLESKSASGGIRSGIPIRHCLGAWGQSSKSC